MSAKSPTTVEAKPTTTNNALGIPVAPSKQLFVHPGNDARPLSAPASNSLHAEGLSAAGLPVGENGGVEACCLAGVFGAKNGW